MEEYKLESRKTNFGGEDGYMVRQLRGGICVAEQFVFSEEYEEFCHAIGTVPEEKFS